MPKFNHPRLSNRGSKLHYLADTTALAYTELGRGSDFTGPRYTMGTGEGMGFENAGHRLPTPQDRGGTGTFTIKLNYGAARPTFVVGDVLHLIKEYEDGFATHIYVLLTEADPGALSPNGLPQWTGTYVTLEDPVDITPTDLADWLSLDLPV
jgi:hypothetical protein